ncbi:Undecaprenyl-phosphate 4-deoxy-4-formamido-L-arabinose transferase [Pseudovibrio axinellae]|uniref:Undecaprenyl-phosphate 4-deoxy-4-formamido-L-arabinose transferase n=1 Tax=Pseudovibrio axinellae TaxID=989403 RepID=A0A166B0I1_9HYPH|nr:glycosyltransferase family 2 protein [Pseudovibrio axinellae]KZL21787.1 Undecaprenyl-phosphate 4-deoxy-4-formamido-L-arabinose transferase [Pseudovibrio axinellae]SEQ78570.1 dolichol-phosphate mannosyltransferase [Pseudovibrio axinellae]
MNADHAVQDIDISVVIPAKNERDNLPVLLDEIAEALKEYRFEAVVVDDGSSDDSLEVLEAYAKQNGFLKVVHHQCSAGQSCSVRTGLLHARGTYIGTIDGDGQNNPAYYRQMIAAVEDGGERVGLAAGQRLGRKASVFKRYASKAANKLRGALLKDNTRDSGCGLKLLRRDVFLKLPYFDSWHRFLPALVIREGYEVVHVDVIDREREHGVSKYGIFDRALVGILDLFGVWWLRRRRKVIPEVVVLTDCDVSSSKEDH